MKLDDKTILLITKAEQGDVEAQTDILVNLSAEQHFALGDIYREGNGVNKNLKKAVFWYERAASSDCFYSKKLGDMYKDGIFDKDIEKAIYWYEKSVDQSTDNDTSCAACTLGDLYFEGILVERNLKESAYWYNKANYQACYECPDYPAGRLDKINNIQAVKTLYSGN